MANQCTGRTNSVRLAPQRIRLLMGKPARAFSTSAGINEAVGSPPLWLVCMSFSSLPSMPVGKLLTSRPFFLAKASAAFVGAPSLKATRVGGPQAVISSSGVVAGRPSINKAKRRGAAKGVWLLKVILAALRPLKILWVNALLRLLRATGGSSSVPNSTKNAWLIRLYPLRLIY